MADYFRDPTRRLARAKEHINDLDAGIRTFLAKNPYATVIDVDPQTGNKTHKVKLTETLSDKLLDQAVEIAEGLRSILDKAGFAAARATGNTRLKGTYFPIADTETQIDTDIVGRGRCRDLPKEILALFRTFKPYKAGNPLLWGVNQLANGTKHRILIPVGMSVGNAFMNTFRNPGLTISMGFPPRWITENDEMVLCVVGPDANPQYDMRLEMMVEIRPIEGFPRGPATGIFSAIASEVERVLMATKAEITRILKSTPKPPSPDLLPCRRWSIFCMCFVKVIILTYYVRSSNGMRKNLYFTNGTLTAIED